MTGKLLKIIQQFLLMKKEKKKKKSVLPIFQNTTQIVKTNYSFDNFKRGRMALC